MNVVLYSTGCPKCCVLKKKLEEKNITFAENSSVDDMVAIGISHVPVLSVDGELYEFSQANEWVNRQ